VRAINNGNQVAFFVRFRLKDRAAPANDIVTYWNDGYITMLPGETRTLVATHSGGADVEIVTEVWNDIIGTGHT